MNRSLGAFSDRCTSRFGRRRPYLFGGTIVSTCALLLLGYTKAVSSIFGLSDVHVCRSHLNVVSSHSSAVLYVISPPQRDRLTIWLAVLSIYFIDFSVNAIMACTRAILVDALPASEQEMANAWAGRMSGVGSIAGFFVSVRGLRCCFLHSFLTLLSIQRQHQSPSNFSLPRTHTTSSCVSPFWFSTCYHQRHHDLLC